LERSLKLLEIFKKLIGALFEIVLNLEKSKLKRSVKLSEILNN